MVPGLLRMLCDFTGLGFAAVAEVSGDAWTACAVEDRAGFGLAPGSVLPLDTVLCRESKALGAPVAVDHVSRDPRYRDHPGPKAYGIESYLTVPILRADGSHFGNLCAVGRGPAQVSNARTVGMFESVARMIGQQLDNDELLERAGAEIARQQETAALREEFIAVLGHDLRNPLAAVAFSAALLEGQPEAANRTIGRRLRQSVHRMQGLIDNVMDLARVRLGSGLGLEIRSAEVLADQLRAVVDEARAAHPGIRIDARIDIDAPVACDPARIQQLVSNLLGNACHHGDGSLPVAFDARIAQGMLELSVANAGGGIAAQDLPKIFEPYWRPASSAPGAGLGLGLYICAEIAKAHGGTVGAASDAVEGTRFTARIPAARTP
jgi:signal transduction histidine kinase